MTRRGPGEKPAGCRFFDDTFWLKGNLLMCKECEYESICDAVHVVRHLRSCSLYPSPILAAIAAVSAKPPTLPPIDPIIVSLLRKAQAGPQEGPAPAVGAAMFPKPKGRRECRRYRSFVRTWPCRSCGTRDGIQASHHGPRPTGRKTDDSRCIPLCYHCHMGKGGFHDTGKLPGRPELEGDALRAFLLDTMVELLTDYFWGSGEGGEVEVAPPLSEAEAAYVEALIDDAPGIGP